MAQSVTFNVPMSAVGPSTPVNPVFKTKRTGADRLSAAVKMTACHFDDKAKAIRVFCDDGLVRQCNIDRLPSIEYARNLWKQIQSAGAAGVQVQFKAAGGFSPDKWFYDFEVVADESVTL
jgi:hypothetical protein